MPSLRTIVSRRLFGIGVATLLPTPNSQYTASVAAFINDAGEAAGYESSSTTSKAIVCNGLTPTVLDAMLGCNAGFASGINNNGLVVGAIHCDVPTANALAAAFWQGTTAAMLPRGYDGQAYAVNNSGLIVGYLYDGDALSGHAATVWVAGKVRILGTVSPGAESEAFAVNNRGAIVGFNAMSPNVPHAVLWNRVGAEPQDLNSLILPAAAKLHSLHAATGINDRCAIVVNG